MDRKIILRRGFYLRVALISDLWVYLISLTLLSTLNVFNLGEDIDGRGNLSWLLSLFGIFPAILLFGRLVEKPKIAKNEWAYFVTAFYGLLVAIYILISLPIEKFTVYPDRLVVTLSFVMVGVVGSIGAHILDGGDKPMGPKIDRWLGAQTDD